MPPLGHLVRLGRTYRSYVTGQETCGHLPLRLWIEPTDVCNLRCVMCPQSEPRAFAKGYMDFGLYTKIIDEAQGFVYDVNLHHRGESTIHPRLADMVRSAKDAGIYTRLHTNGTLLDEKKAEQLVEAGLDLISFSFDGYDRESYEKIRVKAKFDRTLGNILRFLEVKRRLGKATPYAIFETIDFSAGPPTPADRERERGFRARFAGLPLDRFVVKRPHNWAGTYAPGDPRLQGKPRRYSPCTFPWYSMVIFWDGTVTPCPQDWYGELYLGDVKRQSLREIWNGPAMVELRKKMRAQDVGCLTPCNQCDMLWRPTFLGVPTTNMKDFLKENLLGYTQ
ncbi:MAG: SPASM domain-containing protein [Candidatus Rokubacteria bacterium]|nr:SPASM domain-containing protein [Candidatus Rokubacteria bacterium]